MRYQYFFISIFVFLIVINISEQLVNKWTRSREGCICHNDHSKTNCACCVDGGCQCGFINKHRCAQCGAVSRIKCLFGSDNNPDSNGWTGHLRCPCFNNPSDRTCACCENDGCQCRNNPKVCTQCGREDQCYVAPVEKICTTPRVPTTIMEELTTQTCPPCPTQPPTTQPPTTTTTTQPPTTTARITTTTTRRPYYVYRRNADCDTIAMTHQRNDGVYELQPGSHPAFNAYCDMSSYGEGYTVIMSRHSDKQDFNQPWDKYKNGFGTIKGNGDFWLGLDKIYYLTNQRKYKLLITIQEWGGSFKYATYDEFRVESEARGYRLRVSGYTGNAGNALQYTGNDNKTYHLGQPFSTHDKDQDNSERNCAETFRSGWWFNDCYWANLNGPYVKSNNGWPRCRPDGCIAWLSHDRQYSLKSVMMKILPNPRYDYPTGTNN